MIGDSMNQRSDWCPTCGDGIAHRPSDWRPDEEQPCQRCGAPSGSAHLLCPEHQIQVEDMLRASLPALFRRLEERYGDELDRFVTTGRLDGSRWWLANPSAVAKHWAERAWEAQFENDGSFDLRFLAGRPFPHAKDDDPRPFWRSWSYADQDWFIPYLTERLASALEQAIADMPTGPIERQLLDGFIGKIEAIEGEDIQSGAREIITGVLTGPAYSMLSRGARQLASLRYDDHDYEWHGWDEPPSIWRDHLDLLPVAEQQLVASMLREPDMDEGDPC